MSHGDARSWLSVILFGALVVVVLFEIGHHYFNFPANSIVQSVMERASKGRAR